MTTTLSAHKTTHFHRVKGIVRAMRPRQWTKNGTLLIGIIFAHRLFTRIDFTRAVLAFVIFCMVSSCVYLLNDIIDVQRDRQHPIKKLRPLASGLVPLHWAVGTIVFLSVICISLLFLLFQLPLASRHDVFSRVGGANILFTLTILFYVGIMILYSTYLKHIVLIDVFIIASGFVLRTLAGAIVIAVSVSPWLYLVTCFLSLFLALSKRRHELVLLHEQANQHRLALKGYSIALLDQMITIVVTGTIISYSLYTIEGTAKDHSLILTIPFVLYGTFRYLYLIYMHESGGSPEEILLQDMHIGVSVVLCILTTVGLLYFLPVISALMR